MAFKMAGFSAFTKKEKNEYEPQTVNPKKELVPQTQLDKANQGIENYTNYYNKAVKSGNKEKIRKAKMDLDHAKRILEETKTGN